MVVLSCVTFLAYWCVWCCFCFFFKQMTAYGMRISDWSSDVCSSDLPLSSEACRAHGALLQQPHWFSSRRDTPGNRCVSAAAPASRVPWHRAQPSTCESPHGTCPDRRTASVRSVGRESAERPRPHRSPALRHWPRETAGIRRQSSPARSEEHTSELQSL